jgi:hypothetical protein
MVFFFFNGNVFIADFSMAMLTSVGHIRWVIGVMGMTLMEMLSELEHGP